jgi:hypothetical protein
MTPSATQIGASRRARQTTRTTLRMSSCSHTHTELRPSTLRTPLDPLMTVLRTAVCLSSLGAYISTNSSKGYGTCSGAGGANGFLCQHRWTNIASMIPFRVACGNAPLQDWTASTNNRIAFGRGSIGFVLINYSGSAWSANVHASLPSGNYCDVVSGGKQGGWCSGATVSVSSGTVNVQVPAYSAIAIYTGAKL